MQPNDNNPDMLRRKFPMKEKNNVNLTTSGGNFASYLHLNVDIFGVPSQKCHRLSLVHFKATHISPAGSSAPAHQLVCHNLVVNVCYCQHLLNQSGSGASPGLWWNPYSPLYPLPEPQTYIQCHCADWMVSGPMYKNCTITEECGVQNLRGNLDSSYLG